MKQLWDSRLRTDDETEQSIDFNHIKCEFPITAKVLAANCYWMSTCVCVCVCVYRYGTVQCPIFNRPKIIIIIIKEKL